MIANQKTTAPLKIFGPIWVVHLVPLAGLAGRAPVDLRRIHTTREWTRILPSPDASCTFNFDGLLIDLSGGQKDYDAYAHIFRTGALEGARAASDTSPDGSSEPKSHVIRSVSMSRFFHGSVDKCIAALKNWGVAGPALLSIGILNTRGYSLCVDNHTSGRRKADRPHLVPDGSWIEDIESADIDAALRPLLDTLWQAFGLERCQDFNKSTGAFELRKL